MSNGFIRTLLGVSILLANVILATADLQAQEPPPRSGLGCLRCPFRRTGLPSGSSTTSPGLPAVPRRQSSLESGLTLVKICGVHRSTFLGRNTARLSGDDLTDAQGYATKEPSMATQTRGITRRSAT